MADALISTPIAAAAGVISISMIAIAARKAKTDQRDDSIALMGVLGAFVFAAQMINFTIPGTGSSGHIIGGVLLSALLGPWCGFLTLCSVLIVQCLIFADGGLMALGCNILNMAVMSCLVAYPLIYKPIAKANTSPQRIVWASILACVVGLELGAFLVTMETELSGITALPTGEFLMFMLPIHLAIGLCEGIATGLVLVFVLKNSPALLSQGFQHESKKSRKQVIWAFAIVAAMLAGAFTWIASENPDGLEWSIMKITGDTELAPAVMPPTSFMPDYESYLSGIIGALIVMLIIWAIASIAFKKKKRASVSE